MIKGVPAVTPNWFFWNILGSPGKSKNLKKTMLKWTSKNGGTEPENQGPEPQSARAGAVETHFRIFWKNFKNQGKYIHFSFLFRSFFAPFLRLFAKSRKRRPGSGPRAIKIRKINLKGAKTEPKNQQSEPQGPTKYKLPRPGARRRRRRSGRGFSERTL